jgi:hypothetical protein
MENEWIGGNKIKKIVKNNAYKMKYLSQGSYGCIFYPGFTCKFNNQSEKFITKIEVRKKDVIKEFEIGEYITKEIPLFKFMFSPILSYCPIHLSKITNDSIKECDLINNDKKILFSTRIKYVGEKSLETYLYSFLEKNNTKTFIKQLFETHLYLTNSIEKLIHNKIVHYDIKENNIIYDDDQHLPIIIDFGLSFRIDLLQTDTSYEKAFYVFITECSWWCLETSIISFIVKKEFNRSNKITFKKIEKSKSWMEYTININDILSIIDNYYLNNNNIQIISKHWNSEVETSKEKWKKYIKGIFKNDKNEMIPNKNAKEIVTILMQSWDTWDMFSISFMYFSLLQSVCEDCFKPYQDYLVKYILEIPLERMKIKIGDYYNKINSFSKNVLQVNNTINVNKEEYIEKSKKNDDYVSKIESILYKK